MRTSNADVGICGCDRPCGDGACLGADCGASVPWWRRLRFVWQRWLPERVSRRCCAKASATRATARTTATSATTPTRTGIAAIAAAARAPIAPTSVAATKTATTTAIGAPAATGTAIVAASIQAADTAIPMAATAGIRTAAPEATAIAFDNGYADGYEAGRRDADRRRPFDPNGEGRYQSGNRGYDSRYGSRDWYRDEYRNGFRSGTRPATATSGAGKSSIVTGDGRPDPAPARSRRAPLM